MIRPTAPIKSIAILISISLLSCGPKEIKPNEVKTLSPELAKTIDWRAKTIKFYTLDGEEQWVFIDGWNEEGFILRRYGQPYILPYSNIQNTIEVETNLNNSAKGARIGLLYGLAGTAMLFLISRFDNDDRPSDVSGFKTGAYIQAAFVWTSLTVSLGLILGSKSHKYEKFHYNADDFRANPWSMEKASEDTLSVKNSPQSGQ